MQTKKGNGMRGCKKVNFLEINERGDPNKVREVGKNRKIDKRGGMFIWHLRVPTT